MKKYQHIKKIQTNTYIILNNILGNSTWRNADDAFHGQ